MTYLDTHIVVWLYAGLVEKLSEKVCTHIEIHDLYMSSIVKLELQYLHEIGRLKVKPGAIVKSLSSSIGLKIANTESIGESAAVVEKALALSWTRDVFDRTITAEAKLYDAFLITKDENIRAHYKRAIW